MILYDYLPSQNAYKVRLLLNQLRRPYETRLVSIFEGAGQHPEFLRKNPMGAVPVLELDDGRVLAESNAILCYLAAGTALLPSDPFAHAKTVQWLCFESDYVQSTVATLRHWRMTGKDGRRGPALVEAKRAGAIKVLQALERELRERAFLVADYSIADIAVFAYVHRSDEAGLPLHEFAAVTAWIDRVKAQPDFLDVVHPYAIDPHSARELP